MSTPAEYQRGFTEGFEVYGPAREADPSLDLRWVLVGEKGDFIRGFSAGLAEYARAQQQRVPSSDHNQGKEP